MKNPRVYWDSFTTSYQMGEQKHRLYLLDLLEEKKINNLLDVGCGTGPIYELLNGRLNPFRKVLSDGFKGRWNFKYKGTDYSQGMIEVCKREFPRGNFEVEDARHLTEGDDSWDAVLLMHSLDHLDDYQSAISEAARVTKKYICIVFWRPFSTSDNLNPKNMMGKKEGDAPWEDTYLHEYNQEDLERCFKENNLVIDHLAFGDTINSSQSTYNFLYLLRK